jgi:hypothetical protein
MIVRTLRTLKTVAAVSLMGALFAAQAQADEVPAVAAGVPDAQPGLRPAALPQYSAPWGLPSVFVGTGARLDNSFAFSHDPQSRNVIADASVFGVSYKLRPGFAVAAKLGWVVNQPGMGDSQTTVSNPAIGAAFTVPFKAGIFFGVALSVAIPVGAGGGDMPDVTTLQANRAGIFARSALDQALFTTNYLTLTPIVSAAWLGHGATVQASAALTQAIRTRGDMVSPDAYQTGLGMGLHVGYYVLRPLSIGAEARYVAALTTTTAVKMNSVMREQISTAIGIRGHFKAGSASLHPGISYTRGIDAPMSTAGYNVLGVDLVIVF